MCVRTPSFSISSCFIPASNEPGTLGYLANAERGAKHDWRLFSIDCDRV